MPARPVSPSQKRPFGRSLSDFAPLQPAEELLRKSSLTGEVAVIGDGRPEEPNAQIRVRPGFVRFLALGGDEAAPVHEKGVRIEGAWIDGSLDLVSCTIKAPLMLEKCTVAGDIVARNATIAGLNLPGTHIRGLFANRLVCRGSMFLRDGFCATGEVRYGGARISGNLSVSGGNFLDTGPKSLSFAGVRISGALLLQEIGDLAGGVSLAGAETTMYADDPATLAKMGEVELDGFRFHRFTKGAPVDALTRISFLEKQPKRHLADDFRSQPWEQIISVMRRMGHGDDADQVAMAKQRHMRRAGGYITGVARPFHWLFGALAGYGYRPGRTIVSMLVVWLLCGAIYSYAADKGWMGPSNPLIHGNVTYAEECRKTGWAGCKQVPPEYTTFQPWFYSADIILPLVRLQQDNDWAPVVVDVNGKSLPGGVWTRRLMWFEILFGWAASLLLVAVLSNLVKKD